MTRTGFFMCALALGGCLGATDEGGQTSLVRLDDEPAGARCPSGGIAVRSGLDRDDDGSLGDDEVRESRYVCHGSGADGATSLVSIDDEPPGERCAAGGRAVHHGVDADRDGTLSAGEIAGTDYVCDGQDGVGQSGLVSVVPEPPGAHCEVGGQAIRSGLDADADGLLDPGEVAATSYVCDGVSGVEALVRAVDELPGGDCAHGGQRILSGLDLDADGYLGLAEVSASALVCHGAPGDPGRSTAFSAVAEPPGARCAAGGVRIESGLDDDGDGALGAGEIDATSYLCDAGSLAVRVSRAPWGGVCPYGGVLVETGTDADASGALADSEVERAEHVCNVVPVQVAAGNEHSCMLMSDGSVRCWGANQNRQLGDGTLLSRLAPVPVVGVAGATEIDTSADHTCALIADGTVRCWGPNGTGLLGDGTTTPRSTAVTVTGLSGVAEISAGASHTCARLTDGSAWCWGLNGDGQLGDGTTANRTTPVAVSGLSGVRRIAAGGWSSCAVLDDGSAVCWGRNSAGQLGDGTTTRRTTPVPVSGLADGAAIDIGRQHACAIVGSGSVYCWGAGSSGQLGDGASATRTTPVLVAYITEATEIDVGAAFTCARVDTTRVECWGSNAQGQLGTGSGTAMEALPVLAFRSASSVATGAGHTLAIDSGAAYAWGLNERGQLGDGTTTARATAVRVASAPSL